MTPGIKSTEAPVSGYKYMIAVPFFVGLAIATLSPLDVLKYQVPQTITEVASYIFPTVRKIDENYEFGSVAKLYFSVMWLMSPSIFLYCFKEIQSQASKVIPKCRENKWTSLFFGLIPIMK